ncbi:hypothetical protein [Halobacillus halophilus]|uniref:hypothetical protein n=1 Tax=Halobacillus halophilus TaxID=1570 RepID=UPI001CD7A691|nr:hypothetical protein [Halobacillus halophilus]MCA1013026.1 hypothetical protein [Halobacillus halophilus]
MSVSKLIKGGGEVGIFFKQMSESQIKNSRQGIYQGFFVYMVLLLVNLIGDSFFEGPVFSSAFVFWLE